MLNIEWNTTMLLNNVMHFHYINYVIIVGICLVWLTL